MRRSINIKQDLETVRTIEDLTEVFESIASLHISKIRDRVVASKDFFAELWQTYSALRIDPKKRLARAHTKKDSVFVAVASQSKLSGQINEQVINELTNNLYKRPNTDVILIGMQPNQALHNAKANVVGAFALPKGDFNFNINDILETLNNYDKISVFYQTYESLRVQKISHIDLVSTVRLLGEDVTEGNETLSSEEYIFEPNVKEIADYMESIMLGVALIQIIMESKLSQYAARFNSMSAAKKRAGELTKQYKSEFYRSKRGESDERLKEMLKVAKRANAL
ncbi:MAG TPA: F0F1 ATP synthase subunit gamma [Candidatus Saccharimonadales bacterium]|nr:F0F1 ATP synthase subunit gamma [Candidatus Saccharimonadales bacterium]